MPETSTVPTAELSMLRTLLQPGDLLYYFETYRVKTKYTSVVQYWAIDVQGRCLLDVSLVISNLLGVSFSDRYAGVELNVNEHPAAVVASQLGFLLHNDRRALLYKHLPGHPGRMPLKVIKHAPKDDA